MTVSPGFFPLGMLSPVMAAWSIITIAFGDDAVPQDAFARADDDDIAVWTCSAGITSSSPPRMTDAVFGARSTKLAERVRGFGFGTRLKIFSHGDQRQDHGRRFKIQRVRIFVHQRHIPVAETVGHAVHGKFRNKRRARADRTSGSILGGAGVSALSPF